MALDDEPDEDPYALIAQAEALDFGVPERSDLLDRAIVLADRSGSVPAQFAARLARANDATFSGQPDLLLAHFAWCQRAADRDPQLVNFEMFWYYKFVIAQVALFARISPRQMDAIDADMMTRYVDNGISRRPVFTSRAFKFLLQGRTADARHAWDEAMRHPRDAHADCLACEAGNAVHLLVQERRFDEALLAAEPIVQGRLKCAEVPHTVLPAVMLAHHARGDTARAEALAERSYRLIRSNPDFLADVCLHVQFLVATQRLDKAARMLIRHAAWVRATTSDLSRLRFAKAVHAVLAAVRDQGLAPSWAGTLDEVVEKAFGPGEHAIDTVEAEGLRLASALDARNANEHWSNAWRAAPFSG